MSQQTLCRKWFPAQERSWFQTFSSAFHYASWCSNPLYGHLSTQLPKWKAVENILNFESVIYSKDFTEAYLTHHSSKVRVLLWLIWSEVVLRKHSITDFDQTIAYISNSLLQIASHPAQRPASKGQNIWFYYNMWMRRAQISLFSDVCKLSW